MRYWLFLLGFSALLYGEMVQQIDIDQLKIVQPRELSHSQNVEFSSGLSLEGEKSFAPLAPLEPQFPLGLTQANRQLFIDNPTRLAEEKLRNQRLLADHTFPWLGVLIFLACGAIGWIAYLMRDQWPKKPKESIVQLPPEQQAKKALRELKKSHFLEQGQFKDYYAELTAIFLAALQERIKVHATGLTTVELSQVLADQPALSQHLKSDILSFLTKADQIKFAGKEPSLEDIQKEDHYLLGLIESLYAEEKKNLSEK